MIVLIDSLAIVCLILAWWVALGSYPRLPERIPVHFGFSGEADSWGGRWMIFLMPAVATLIVALDWFIFSQLKDSPKMPAAMELPLHLLMLELSALFAYITWRMSEIAFERAKGLGVWFLPVVLLGIMGTSAWMIVAGKSH
ncbi:MAG: DUF1648 domain-containing protein [Acidobacteriota bacterium]|nr:DUF1648 domain-containing protein [Acidobacteriota bacterium]